MSRPRASVPRRRNDSSMPGGAKISRAAAAAQTDLDRKRNTSFRSEFRVSPEPLRHAKLKSTDFTRNVRLYTIFYLEAARHRSGGGRTPVAATRTAGEPDGHPARPQAEAVPPRLLPSGASAARDATLPVDLASPIARHTAEGDRARRGEGAPPGRAERKSAVKPVELARGSMLAMSREGAPPRDEPAAVPGRPRWPPRDGAPGFPVALSRDRGPPLR